MENLTFKKITTRKEYIDKRLELVNSMVLFFCYLPDETDEMWYEFLNSINENYNKSVIEIILVSTPTHILIYHFTYPTSLTYS